MCVIFVADKVRPTEEMLQLGYENNPHSRGIAWIEEVKGKDDKPENMVRWKKGITLEEVKALNEKLPLPYVIHFRNPSHDAGKDDDCAHPFPVDARVPAYLDGQTAGSVIFHNGYWTRWKDNIIEAAIKAHLKLPPGQWSDSRGLAWMAAHFGSGILELINEKVVELSADGSLEIYGPQQGHNPWVRVNGVLCSNVAWERKGHTSFTTPPRSMGGGGRGQTDTTNNRHDQGHRKDASTGGSALETPFRSERGSGSEAEAGPESQGLHQQEAVEEADASARQADRQESAWSRSLNEKRFRSSGRIAPIVRDGVPREACRTCFIEVGALLARATNDPICPKCWMELYGWQEETKAQVPSKTCKKCKIRLSTATVLATGDPICGPCFEESGRPPIRRVLRASDDPDLEQRRRDAARGISRIGSM